jgi:hypothetical protein
MNSKNPVANSLAWIYIGTVVYLDHQATNRLDELLRYLESDSLNPKVHKDFLVGLEKFNALSNIGLTPVYDRVLEILMSNPENSQVIDLAHKTGQWYFKCQEPRKIYTLDDLSQVQALLIKKKELEMLVLRLEVDSEEDFIRASEWIKRLDFSEFGNNAVKRRLIDLRSEFLEKFSASLLRRMTAHPSNENLHSLLKSTLEIFARPDPACYELFLVSLLGYVAIDSANRNIKEFLMFSLDKAPGINGVSSLKIYNTLLDLFEDSASQKNLRTLVLDVGRWHFSRKNWLRRSPKPEDEQQMQNDILMRLKS